MIPGRLQVLADRQHLAIVRAQVAHHITYLVQFFTETEHQSRLGGYLRMRGLEVADQVERMLIVGARSGLPIQARNGFQVVIENIRRADVHQFQRDLHAAAEIRHQDFDPDAGAFFADRADAVNEMFGPAVAQVVAIHRGYYYIAQFHVMDGLRQVLRFLLVQRRRPAVTDIAKRAAPRADVAHDHECCRSVAKTFGEIGATGFLAYRVQVLVTQHGFDFRDRVRGRRLDPDPWRLAQRRHRHFDFHGDARHFFLGAEFLPWF